MQDDASFKLIIDAPIGCLTRRTCAFAQGHCLRPVDPAGSCAFSHRAIVLDRSSFPYSMAARGIGALYGIGPAAQERLTPFALRRWEILSEPTPNVGQNDTSLSLGLFEAIKIQ